MPHHIYADDNTVYKLKLLAAALHSWDKMPWWKRMWEAFRYRARYNDVQKDLLNWATQMGGEIKETDPEWLKKILWEIQQEDYKSPPK